jgi:hypothetical protein
MKDNTNSKVLFHLSIDCDGQFDRLLYVFDCKEHRECIEVLRKICCKYPNGYYYHSDESHTDTRENEMLHSILEFVNPCDEEDDAVTSPTHWSKIWKDCEYSLSEEFLVYSVESLHIVV